MMSSLLHFEQTKYAVSTQCTTVSDEQIFSWPEHVLLIII